MNTASGTGKKPAIGFIGQGYVGKNYADNFESRGFPVIRYSIEPEHAKNKEMIRTCSVVFIAVPTPTTPAGPDHSIVDEAVSLAGTGAVVVIKSTIVPGTTAMLQKKYSDRIVLHSPEFLTSSTARKDVDSPNRNIIGISTEDDAHMKAARSVLDILPRAPFELVCSSTESEFIKYAGNTFYYAKTVYMNTLYDLAQKLGVDWANVKPALAADPWIGPMHIEPIHKTGRGAGGHCLIKDFAALKRVYDAAFKNGEGKELMAAIEKANLALLASTNKDLDIVEKVYGPARGARRNQP